jgi:predicted protein tyrosine phosphatase
LAFHHGGDVNLLFVCTLNKARSTTAASLYRRTPGISVRSAGTSDRAVHQLNETDLIWADRVVVFEAEHELWIRATFEGDLPEIAQAGIPDEYNAGDPALVAELSEALTPLLGPPGNPT